MIQVIDSIPWVRCASGQWWPRPWSSVSSLLHEFKSAGRWYFPEHTKAREKPVWSVHNNWVVSWTILLFTMGMIVKLNDHFIQIGNQKKIARAKQFGHWFFNETSDSCIVSPTLSDLQQPKWTGPSALAPALLKSCWAVVLLPGNFHIQKKWKLPGPNEFLYAAKTSVKLKNLLHRSSALGRPKMWLAEVDWSHPLRTRKEERCSISAEAWTAIFF